MIGRFIVGGLLVVVGFVALVVRVLLDDLTRSAAASLMAVTWIGLLAGTFVVAHAAATVVKRRARV